MQMGFRKKSTDLFKSVSQILYRDTDFMKIGSELGPVECTHGFTKI